MLHFPGLGRMAFFTVVVGVRMIPRFSPCIHTVVAGNAGIRNPVVIHIHIRPVGGALMTRVAVTAGLDMV